MIAFDGFSNGFRWLFDSCFAMAFRDGFFDSCFRDGFLRWLLAFDGLLWLSIAFVAMAF